ncbi:MAG: hypothetical protein QGH83_02055 [Candidatus Pacebacteria bacterium]|jgi:hypothetical protein|nr:hypothetical protein [Candidatus Paceibacterota bacterium]
MKTYEQLLYEYKGGTVVFTFGRFNPPTTGHEKLLNVLMNASSKERGEYFAFMSHSQDKKKNPLTHDQKMMFMKLMFPKHRSAFVKSKARNALEVLVQLYDMKRYSKAVMVVGSDRVKDFNVLLNKYNGEQSKHGLYDFEEIRVISAGERDPDAEGVEGMSASKMRAAVVDSNYDVFKMGVPAGVSDKDCHKLYSAVAKGMGVSINEEIDEDAKMARQSDIQLKKLLQKASAMDQSSPANKSFTQRIKKEFKKRGLSETMTIGDVLDKIVEDAEREELEEALSPSQRRKMGLRMRILAKKPGFIMKRKRAMKKVASKQKLDHRARKAAIKLITKKFFPKLKTKKTSDLSYAERGKISDIVKKKKSVIDRFAKRLVKDKRKQDIERRKNINKNKEK